jgi:hypothetical protein
MEFRSWANNARGRISLVAVTFLPGLWESHGPKSFLLGGPKDAHLLKPTCVLVAFLLDPVFRVSHDYHSFVTSSSEQVSYQHLSFAAEPNDYCPLL